MYIPFVEVIIKHIKNNQIFVQERHNFWDEKTGTIEISGGKLRAYEDTYDTAKREVKEEYGLDITVITNENQKIEIKMAKWLEIFELSEIVKSTPKRIYTPFLGSLMKYLEVL